MFILNSENCEWIKIGSYSYGLLFGIICEERSEKLKENDRLSFNQPVGRCKLALLFIWRMQHIQGLATVWFY